MFGEVGGSLCFVPFEPHNIIVNTMCMYVKIWRVFLGRDNGEGRGERVSRLRTSEEKSIWHIANSVWSGMESGRLCHQLYAISHTLLSPKRYASRFTGIEYAARTGSIAGEGGGVVWSV
jgi:hypothetical protein